MSTKKKPKECKDCLLTEKKFPGYGYRCRKFPKCGHPHHPGGCPCGCKTP